MRDDSGLALTAARPVEARILKRNPDGSGVVEIPVMVETDQLDLSRTSGGGTKTATITLDDLKQAVRNFALWAGPVPIHRDPHRDYAETAGPADGFIEALSLRGTQLVAQVFLTPSLMAEVAAGQWRGFSVDMVRNGLKRPTGELKGLVVIGGVLTNRPALDVNYRIAASERIAAAAKADPKEAGSHLMQFSIAANAANEGRRTVENEQPLTVQLATAVAERDTAKEKQVSLTADLEASREEVTTRNTRISQLEASLSAALDGERNAKASLDIKAREVKDQETHATSLQAQLASERTEHGKLKGEVLGAQVLKLCIDGVRRGAPPSFFGAKGLDGVKADPVGWVTERFAGSTKMLEDFVNALPKTASLSGVKSGFDPADDNEPVMDKDRRAAVVQLGLDPKFVGITNETQLRELQQKEAAAKK